MGNKTILILVIIALSATVVLQNTGNVPFIFLWAKLSVAKSTIILGALVIGFIAGALIISRNKMNNDNSDKNNDDQNYLN